MTDGWNATRRELEILELRKENGHLRKTLSAAAGYLMNAKIDLETGAPKRTAVRTIEGGLKLVNEALAPAPPSPIGGEQP